MALSPLVIPTKIKKNNLFGLKTLQTNYFDEEMVSERRVSDGNLKKCSVRSEPAQ